MSELKRGGRSCMYMYLPEQRSTVGFSGEVVGDEEVLMLKRVVSVKMMVIERRDQHRR